MGRWADKSGHLAATPRCSLLEGEGLLVAFRWHQAAQPLPILTQCVEKTQRQGWTGWKNSVRYGSCPRHDSRQPSVKALMSKAQSPELARRRPHLPLCQSS